MPKTKFKTGERITFELTPEDKTALTDIANKRGLAVGTLCRMIILEIIYNDGTEKD